MNDSSRVVDLRKKLWDACEDCPACGGDEADLAPAEALESWLAGGNEHEATKAVWPWWHLDPKWRDTAV